MIIWLGFVPSPYLAEFLGAIVPYPIGIISITGIIFSIKGIHEKDSYRKLLGILFNLFFTILFFIILFE